MLPRTRALMNFFALIDDVRLLWQVVPQVLLAILPARVVARLIKPFSARHRIQRF